MSKTSTSPVVSRRQVLGATAAGVAAAPLLWRSPSASAAPAPWIAYDGVVGARVVVDDSAHPNVVAAAELIVHCVAKATEVTLATSAPGDPNPDQLFELYVGAIGPGCSISEADLAALDSDGFIIASGTDCLSIAGRTSFGIRFGVSEFLERYVGVRWLLPGDDGEDVPRTTRLAAPTGVRFEQAPAMLSRVLAPLTAQGSAVWTKTDSATAWANANRLRWRIEAGHGLFHVIPPSKYGDPDKPDLYHPEFFPLRNGKPFIPKAAVPWTGWQPRFTAPGIVDAAADTVIGYFDANPDAESMALGVNDASGYSEDEIAGVGINSQQLANMSDIYYGFVRDVVNEVLDRRPDLQSKWFGALAYREVFDPPSFTLPPQVLVLAVRERYGWTDPTFEAGDIDRLAAWKQVGCQVGWYDYAYGALYGAPRIYTDTMSRYVNYGIQHGVLTTQAELSPGWGEGPKGWVYAKLMWGSDRTAAELTAEWCERAVGRHAGPLLEQYYRVWERVWTDKAPDTGWFAAGFNEPYFQFDTPACLNAVDPCDVHLARRLLEHVVSQADTPVQRRRAEALMDFFAYYEATALSFPRDAESTPHSPEQALAAIDASVDKAALAAQRPALAQALYDLPDLAPTPADLLDRGWTWPGWTPYTFWRLVDYVRGHEQAGGPVIERLTTMRDAPSVNRSAEFARLVLGVAAGATSLIADPSFAATGPGAPWFLWIGNTSPGALAHTDEQTFTGNGALKCTGVYKGGPFQTIPITEGLIAARVRYKNTASTSGVVNLNCNLQTATGGAVVTWNRIACRRLLRASNGWEELDLLLDIPKKYGAKTVGQIQVGVSTLVFSEGESVYLDGFELYSL